MAIVDRRDSQDGYDPMGSRPPVAPEIRGGDPPKVTPQEQTPEPQPSMDPQPEGKSSLIEE